MHLIETAWQPPHVMSHGSLTHDIYYHIREAPAIDFEASYIRLLSGIWDLSALCIHMIIFTQNKF